MIISKDECVIGAVGKNNPYNKVFLLFLAAELCCFWTVFSVLNLMVCFLPGLVFSVQILSKTDKNIFEEKPFLDLLVLRNVSL